LPTPGNGGYFADGAGAVLAANILGKLRTVDEYPDRWCDQAICLAIFASEASGALCFNELDIRLARYGIILISDAELLKAVRASSVPEKVHASAWRPTAISC
jgi:hypothetical protein